MNNLVYHSQQTSRRKFNKKTVHYNTQWYVYIKQDNPAGSNSQQINDNEDEGATIL